ncbi:hypothetical protein D3C85_999440 [compost metagenome]
MPLLAICANSSGNHLAMSAASKLPCWPSNATDAKACSIFFGSVILALFCIARIIFAVSVPDAPCPTANLAATGAYFSASANSMPPPTNWFTRSATWVLAMPVSFEVWTMSRAVSISCWVLAVPDLIAMSRMIA